MSDAQEIGGYANDVCVCGACPLCDARPKLDRRAYTPAPELVQRMALQLAGRKLKAYRALTVMAINRSVMHTHRLDDRASEAAAVHAYNNARIAAHNAFLLRPDLCPKPVRVAA